MRKYNLNSHNDIEAFGNDLRDSVLEYAESLILESPITVSCPKCGTEFEAFFGKDNVCPHCQSVIQLEFNSDR